MVFSNEDRVLIKILRQEKKLGAKKFLSQFPNRNWTLSAFNLLISLIDERGSSDKRHRGGRKRSARVPENIGAVQELVLSQEDKLKLTE